MARAGVWGNERRSAPLAALGVVLCLLTACHKRLIDPPSYEVISFNGSRDEWTLIKTGGQDGRTVRIRMVFRCENAMGWDSDGHGHLTSCSLPIGKILKPNPKPAPGHESERLVIDVADDREVTFHEGVGDGRSLQTFDVVKQDLISAK